ncbi:MAG: AI-2E family transporter [Patescibacteria group bacterium]|nr:AI-2E family transporter [Patescibacteria group bacterium]
MTWTKLVVVGLTFVSLLVVWKTHQVWSAAFLGVLFALSLNGPAEWLRRQIRLPRWLATSLVMFVVLVTLTGLGWVIGSPLAVQFDDMSKELPAVTQKTLAWLDQRPWGHSIVQRVEDWSGMSPSSPRADDSSEVPSSGRTPIDLPKEQLQEDGQSDKSEASKDEARPDEGASSTPGYAELLGHVAGALSATVNAGMLLALSMVVMLFVAFDPHVYQRGVLWLVPEPHETVASQTMDRLCVAMRWWMVGRLVSMTVVGVLTALGMWMIGMPAPLALGAIAGLLSFIPNIGPIIAAIPGLLLAVGSGPWMVLWAGCIYLAAQLIESNAITPLVDQYAIAVPPGVLIVTQFVFAALGGAWGMLVATPLLVVVMVMVQELYVKQGLHKQIEVTGST